jgi:outer membrane protein assembly factor BamD (BamD/ComL family)
VLEKEQKQRSLDELEAQLASIPDPLEEIQKQVDKTAFILVYQADRLYRELNRTDSAVETYNRVIELFPKNRWAQVARQRLSEIEEQRKI